jgi:DNA helicase HerA-like ATPase
MVSVMTDLIFADGADNSTASLVLKRINRHGLVTGATGTGKTVTLQTLAETMALAGIPVFVTDVKGDLSGIALPKELGRTVAPAMFWDILGKQGHSIHTTITEFGPVLLGQLLNLSDVQRGVLELAFHVAQDQDLLLLDLKDLRACLQYIADNSKAISAQYGLVSNASIAAIQRNLLSLENEGGSFFFGEPALDLQDLMHTDAQGRGMVNILCANEIMQRPRLYATFLLWLLTQLFDTLPESGDVPKPKLVLFFDEAHLLFDNAPKILLDKVEQVVRLIRSKGVGVYFVTQNPADIPEGIQGQLGNRVQHALRAFTPAEQKKVKAAATSLRANPAFDTEQAINELGVGEALVSTLDDKGTPTIVQRVKVRLPQSRLGVLQPMEQRQLMAISPVAGKYDTPIDRESAYERLQKRQEEQAQQQATSKTTDKPAKSGRRSDTFFEAAAKSAIRSASSQAGRQLSNRIVRFLFDALKGK